MDPKHENWVKGTKNRSLLHLQYFNYFQKFHESKK